MLLAGAEAGSPPDELPRAHSVQESRLLRGGEERMKSGISWVKLLLFAVFLMSSAHVLLI